MSFSEAFSQGMEYLSHRIEQILGQVGYCQECLQQDNTAWPTENKKPVVILMTELLEELHVLEMVFACRMKGFEMPQ